MASKFIPSWETALSILGNATEGICIFESKTKRFKYANAAICLMFGYSSSEFLMLSLDDLHPHGVPAQASGDSVDQPPCHMRRSSTVLCIRKDARVFGADMNTFRATVDGTPCIVAYFYDVTERTQAHEDAASSLELILKEREKLAKIAATVPGVICSFRQRPDGSAHMPYCSPAAVDVQGFAPDEMNQDMSTVFALVHPDDAKGVKDSIAESARTMTPWRHEYRYYHPRKGLIWLEGHSMPLREPDGSIIWHGFVTDITKRKGAEEEVAAERERLAVTLRCISCGVIATDRHGVVSMMNKAAESLTGWPEAMATGRPITDVLTIINELTRKPCADLTGEVLASGTSTGLAQITILISRDGTERLVLPSFSPITDRCGETIGAVVVIRDITDTQKLIEISQRNLKLEALGVLAGGIAHDFNNLLGGIFNYIDLAKGCSMSPNAAGYLERALNTITRVRGLTHQLLTIAKGGSSIRKVGTLFPFVQETVEFALSGSRVSCHYRVHEDLNACNFDREQIGQVIDNIINNAQQAMPNGGTIEVDASNVRVEEPDHHPLAPGDYVKITIKDSGIGIPKEDLQRIFDPFYTTKSKGHGLGLAICHSIVTRHGGYINVESELGKGSSFHIYLPAAAESAGSAPAVQAPEHRGSGTIIVMDDEEVMRDSIARMLRSLGYNAICTSDGRESLAVLDRETQAGRSVTAMIVDFTVPGGMGGKDVMSEIRKRKVEIPVFVVSGYADDPVMTKPVEYGFTASICKPFRKDDMTSMLARHIKTR